jgi:hypothetical protein
MLIEPWCNTTVREGFTCGRSLKEISDETGLSEEDVLQREVELCGSPCARRVLHTAGTPLDWSQKWLP